MATFMRDQKSWKELMDKNEKALGVAFAGMLISTLLAGGTMIWAFDSWRKLGAVGMHRAFTEEIGNISWNEK